MKIEAIFFYKSKKKKVYEIVKELVDFIDNYIDKNSLLQKLFNDLNFILNVPNIILKKRSKQLLFKSYEFEKKKFNDKYSLTNVFFDFIILFGFLIIFLINSFFYKKNKIKKSILFVKIFTQKKIFINTKVFQNISNQFFYLDIEK